MTKDEGKITIRKIPACCGKYAIKIEGKIVWEGIELQEKFPLIVSENPGKNLSICWKHEREFLVV